MNILPNYEIQAAWVRIEPELKQFKRGDDVSDEWVERVGQVKAYRLEPRIKRYFIRPERGIEMRRSGDRLHLMTDDEQDELSRKRTEIANRSDKRAIRALAFVDASKLSEVRARERDFRLAHLKARVESFEKHKRESKVLMGAPSPRPSLKVAK